MPGYETNGLPAPTVTDGSLPIPSTARFAMDTRLPGGQYPQSVAVSAQQIAAAGGGAAVPLTDAATIALDASLGNLFSVTLGGSRTLAISNASPGQRIRIKVTQDGTGSRTLTVTGAVVSGTPLTTTAAAVDLVEIMALTATTFMYFPVAKAFA